MMPTDRWRQLLQERLAEAVTVLGAVPGVHGLIVGGSMGSGEPWGVWPPHGMRVLGTPLQTVSRRGFTAADGQPPAPRSSSHSTWIVPGVHRRRLCSVLFSRGSACLQ
jgi:hypothetical protein